MNLIGLTILAIWALGLCGVVFGALALERARP